MLTAATSEALPWEDTMKSLVNTAKTTLGRLWKGSAPLTGAGLLMLAVLVPSLVGLAADERMVTGAPVWLKPAKFAISTAIYMLTLAWIFTLLPEWPRTRRFVGWVTAIVLVLEVGIIDLQAWRGTTSHFNVGTPLDAALFLTMGLAIVVQTLASIAAAVAVWRQTFQDRALGWALRVGLIVTIAGATTGGLMTRPMNTHLERAHETGRIRVAGAHTVGARDGGPGLPGTGWSVEHGDLRIPHFLGLHAMQVLPLLAVVLRRRRSADNVRARLMFVAASSYGSLFGILLWQALRGQSLVQPDGTTLIALTAWAIVTAVAALKATADHTRTASHAVAIS
jgi:hypothetical protein